MSLQCKCGLAAPLFREVEGAWDGKVSLKWSFCFSSSSYGRAAGPSLSEQGCPCTCLLLPVQTALVPQLWKSASPKHFLVNFMEKQWIIHAPPLMSHFHNCFPSFWDFAWHLSGLPDQTEVSTRAWRNFNCLFKKWLAEKLFFLIDCRGFGLRRTWGKEKRGIMDFNGNWVTHLKLD